MNIIEEIHQHLTDTRRNDYDFHGGEPEFLRVQSPHTATNLWHFTIIWDHHDGEIVVLHASDDNFNTAGELLLNKLQEREIGSEEPMET